MADIDDAHSTSTTPQTALQTGLDADAREWIEQKIRAEFDRDRSFLKEILGFAAKALGVAASVLVLVITVAGISTYKQVHEAIVSAATDQVKTALQADNPASAFSRTRDQLVAQAIIDAYRVRISRRDASVGSVEIEVAPADRDRLLKLITDRTTAADSFRDAVDVLSLISANDEKAGAGALYARLSELLAGSGEYAWMRQERTRRMAILDAMVRARATEQLAVALDKILGEDTLPNDLRDASLQAIVTSPSELLLPRVATFCGLKEPPSAAFAALAAIDPSDPRVSKRVESIIKQPAPDSIAELITIAAALAQPRHKAKDSVQKTVATLLKCALDNGTRFTFTSDDQHGGRTVMFLRAPGSRLLLRRAITPPLIQYETARAAFATLLSEASDANVLTYIAALNDGTGSPKDPFRRKSAVVASVGKGGAIVLSDGKLEEGAEVTFYRTPSGVIAESGDSKTAISGKVVGFQDRKAITFVVQGNDSDDDESS